MSFDWVLWDTSNDEIFDLGSKIWFDNLLDYPEALTDDKALAKFIYNALDYIQIEPGYEQYRKEYIPWFSKKLSEFVKNRKIENLKVISDQDNEWQDYPEGFLNKVKLVGSRYYNFYEHL